MAKFHGWYFWSRTQIDRPARIIIRLLFGFASDSVFLNQSTNTETAMLSNITIKEYFPYIAESCCYLQPPTQWPVNAASIVAKTKNGGA